MVHNVEHAHIMPSTPMPIASFAGVKYLDFDPKPVIHGAFEAARDCHQRHSEYCLVINGAYVIERNEFRAMLAEEQREVQLLRQENASLRQQMSEMRGPLGGLAQWDGGSSEAAASESKDLWPA